MPRTTSRPAISGHVSRHCSQYSQYILNVARQFPSVGSDDRGDVYRRILVLWQKEVGEQTPVFGYLLLDGDLGLLQRARGVGQRREERHQPVAAGVDATDAGKQGGHIVVDGNKALVVELTVGRELVFQLRDVLIQGGSG